MATTAQLERADRPMYPDRPAPDGRGGATFTDHALVPETMQGCRLESADVGAAMRVLDRYVVDQEDRVELLAAILGEG